MNVVIGTAGWSIPGKDAAAFDAAGSALERYASRLTGVEINSSFHRSHRPATWARWGASVPDHFRFAVKLPKTVTHQRKLVDCADLLAAFVGEVAQLGPKLAILLVQLPPKLALDAGVAAPFFAQLAGLTPARLACEPRHASWFEDEADTMLAELGVARVAADPALSPRAAERGGWRGLGYWRLHGSPVMYRSAYGPERLTGYAAAIAQEASAAREMWCMFDNTASSAAIGDALELARLLHA
jgi:uncharacterized protein YecE (DUF72 family)